MSTLTIRLFGKLQIHRDDQIVTEVSPGKVQELFAYLLLNHNRLHCRETLAALLWDKCTTTNSLKRLRQALWQLQAALDSSAETSSDNVLLFDAEWIGLNPDVKLWLDVTTFERAFASVQGIQGRTFDSQSFRMVREAVQLYQGEFLEGWYQEWCLRERERLQNIYLAMLAKLMDYCEAHQQYEAGISYGSQILKYDWAREQAHRRLMRLHYLGGNRTLALRQYECCVAALKEELDVPPAKRTLALYQQIQADRVEGLLSPSTEVSQVPANLLSGLIGQLRQVRITLAELQTRVERDIQAIEQFFNERPDQIL